MIYEKLWHADEKMRQEHTLPADIPEIWGQSKVKKKTNILFELSAQYMRNILE